MSPVPVDRAAAAGAGENDRVSAPVALWNAGSWPLPAAVVPGVPGHRDDDNADEAPTSYDKPVQKMLAAAATGRSEEYGGSQIG